MLSRSIRTPLCRSCIRINSVRALRPTSASLIPHSATKKRYNSTASFPTYQPRTDGLEPHHGESMSPASFRTVLTQGPRDRISHTCSSLSANLAGQQVTLGGWMFSQRRASANLHFFTLKDHTGTVQLISKDEKVSERLMNVPLESVVQVNGFIRARKQKAKNSSVSRFFFCMS